MERQGPWRGVRRRGIALSEVMKRSSLILRGTPMQILPQQQARHLSKASTSCSPTLPSLFQPCRGVRQHSSHTIRHERQRVLLLGNNKLQNGTFRVKHFPSSFPGDGRALKLQMSWSKEKFDAAFNLYPTREAKRTADVQSFNRQFYESRRPPGTYPSLVTQLPTALEPRFLSASVDQSKTRNLNALRNFDQCTSSSTLQAVQPGSTARSKAVSTVSTISEHRWSPRAEKSTSDQQASSPINGRPGPRFEPTFMLGKEPLPRSSNKIASRNSNPNFTTQIEAGVESRNVSSSQTVRRTPDGGAHLLSNSHAAQKSYGNRGRIVEPAYVVVDQARSSQNGAHPALNNYRIHVGSVITQTSGVAKVYTPSLQRVQQEMDEFRDKWRLQKMVAELDTREAQLAQPKYRREAEAFPGFQGARGHGSNVAHLEEPSHPSSAGATKWRETAKMIEQNRNPSNEVVSEIEPRQQNTDTLRGEYERVRDVKANVTRSITANSVLEIRELEPLPGRKMQSSAVSQKGWTENSVRQRLRTEELVEFREPEPLSSEEDRQSSAIYENVVTNNSGRQALGAEELLRKAASMDDGSSPASMKGGLNLIAKGRLQSRAGYGSRDCSRDTARGNGSTHMNSAGTTSEAIAVLQNCLELGITTGSYTYVNVLQMCLKRKDLLAAKQVHDCIIKSGMNTNPYVANTLLNVYSRCGRILDARRVFDELERKSVITWNMMIAGYARSGDAESAMELFNLMRHDGAQPTQVTYLCILKACARPLALEWGKQVHKCIRHAGLESDVRVGTALLQMYAKCRCITEASRVFQKLTDRDVVTWNVMIGAYAECGRGVEAYRLLLEMRREGCKPNALTYVSILNASASAGALKWVKEVHAHAREAGLESDLRVRNALVHIYAKSRNIDDARLVFDRTETRDLVTWNIMIGGLAKHGCGHEAYRLFQQMRREGLEPDAITYLSILNASASAGALEWVKEVHGHARQAGLESDVRVGIALVHMYAKSGSIDDARLVFDRMEKRDLVTWNVMIGGLAQHGRGHEAYKLFLRMRREGFEPDAFTYTRILNASASVGALEWVKDVHGHACKAGLESDLRVGNALIHMYAKGGSIDDARAVFDRMEKRDVVIWTAMLGGLAQHGCGHEAYRLFRQMRREGFEPDARTYVSILNACASTGALEWVKEVHGHARKAGLESDVRVGNALIHMYAKCGSIDDARLVFDKMENRDVFTWNIIIGGLAQHGCGDEAYRLFLQMKREGLEPDAITFSAVLSACCHRGLLDDGRRLFSAMTENHGIKPDIVHYTCMVDLLGRAGQLEEAKLFISDMPVEPDAVIWIALLGACRTYGNVELGELAAKEVFKLKPNNASTYVLLSNIYAAAGKWEKVSLVRTVMKERGVRKEPGRSWIQVDNKIHEFVVGDTSHPEARAIKGYLNKLTEKLKAEGYIPDTQLVLQNIDEEDKELALCSHSEKLAIAYGLMCIPGEKPIRVYKNLRVCSDCHTATKLISKVTRREIIARDASRFHHFKDGLCSCGDYW